MYVITLLIFFVHFEFGLNPCIFVKVVLMFVFLFHVLGVFGVIVCEGLFFLLRLKGVFWLSYANLNNVPTQAAGSSEVLAADWNTYVRDNFDALKYGHLVCTSSTRPTSVGEGTMIYETDTNKVLVYNGASWIEISDLDAPLPPFTKRIGFSTSTLNITLSTTLAATGNIFSSITFTASGTDTYKIVVTAPRINGPNVLNGATDIHITNGANTSLGIVASIFQSSTTRTYAPLYGVMYYTPSAGSTTINVSGTSSSGQGGFSGDVGGTNTLVNATLEVLV